MGFQNMNKKGLEFKLALFAIIGLSMIITAVGILVGAWSSHYNANLANNLDEYDVSDDSSQTARDQRAGISPQSSDPGSDFEARSFRGGFGIINSIFNAFDVVLGRDGLLGSITQRFGVPDYIRQGILAMMTIAITMGIIAIIFRLSRRTA